MRAVICQNAELRVLDQPEPIPGPGQVRIKVLRCGICGSDLHLARHGFDAWADVAAKTGYNRFARSTEPIVFGHEFCGEVVEHGSECRRRNSAGTPVVAFPLLLHRKTGVDTLGFSVHAPGAYAEQTVVSESLMMRVPNGLAPEIAALTEPMSVAWHAVRRGGVNKRTVAVVVGCGPVGLGVILMLKAKGVRTIIASDYSPGRRALAARCGAHIVVDPGETSPFTAADRKPPPDLSATLEKIGRIPMWWHAWRLFEVLGAMPKPMVIFECAGAPGIIKSLIDDAPMFARVVVAGICVGGDNFAPMMAVRKEIDLRFSGIYSPLEFRDTLYMLAEGKIDPRPLITGTVGLDGVNSAFNALKDPEAHAKILIDPFAGPAVAA